MLNHHDVHAHDALRSFALCMQQAQVALSTEEDRARHDGKLYASATVRCAERRRALRDPLRAQRLEALRRELLRLRNSLCHQHGAASGLTAELRALCGDRRAVEAEGTARHEAALQLQRRYVGHAARIQPTLVSALLPPRGAAQLALEVAEGRQRVMRLNAERMVLQQRRDELLLLLSDPESGECPSEKARIALFDSRRQREMQRGEQRGILAALRGARAAGREQVRQLCGAVEGLDDAQRNVQQRLATLLDGPGAFRCHGCGAGLLGEWL